MRGDTPMIEKGSVALLAEGVDRNKFSGTKIITPIKSPSSRRAWIEIPPAASGVDGSGVALLAEGVDRNGVVV